MRTGTVSFELKVSACYAVYALSLTILVVRVNSVAFVLFGPLKFGAW